MAIEQEIKDRARELYVYENLTIEQVAKEVDVPEGTVKRWSSEEGWFEERREHKASLADIRRNTLLLRKAFVAKAIGSLDPQDVYAVGRLESLAQRGQKKEEQAQVAVDRPKLFMEDMEFIAATLKEIDPEGLIVLARNFETIVEKFKSQTTDDRRQTTDDSNNSQMTTDK